VTDVYDRAKRSAVMARVKSRDTGPERLLRKDLPGKPDLVMPGRTLAFFVHGCFWHGHDCARGSRVPKANRDYWLAKVARNRARDAAAAQALTADGWRVETLWECEMKDAGALKARLAQTLDQAATRTPPASTWVSAV